MTADRSLIGLASVPTLFEVEKGAVRKLAEALGHPNPINAEGEVTLPTFPTTFRVQIPELNLDTKGTLNGGEEYEYARPIRVGERIMVVRRIVDVFERRGSKGLLTFYIHETEGTDEQGELVYKGRTTIITI